MNEPYIGTIGINTIACPRCLDINAREHRDIGHGTLFITVPNTLYAEMRSHRGTAFPFTAECHHLRHKVTVRLVY